MHNALLTALAPKVLPIIRALYPQQNSEQLVDDILTCAMKWVSNKPHRPPLKESTVYLITYGDAISAADSTSLQALHAFSSRYLRHIISDIHLLPMYP
ncbi:hypothetical protein [Citrobacter amalonaticus]|uniref:hypothetical protein n=1 Tax=Citrobacter amalonaticus TaxID=35703 RepID=UPI001CE25555|nr:hypothetical protein [Citrobacter amalonaticus]